MATITVRGRFALPHSQEAERKENVVWVEPAGGMVHIIFQGKTPVDFRTENPARARVIGVVKDDADMGRYPYRLGGIAESEPEPAATDGSVLSDPELIVSGGLIPKRKRTKRTKRAGSKRSTKAVKRAPAKRAKPARRTKSTKRVKSTSRVSSRKRATKKR
jgi:hypothetical protein